MTGNAEAAGVLAESLAVELLLVELPAAVLLPAAEPQPAARAATATPAATSIQLGLCLCMMCHFLLADRKEGETVGRQRSACPPGRIALPTRVDIVGRGRSRPGLGPLCGPSQLRDSAGMARLNGRHRLRYLTRDRNQRAITPKPGRCHHNTHPAPFRSSSGVRLRAR
jgi:hypothetical protein